MTLGLLVFAQKAASVGSGAVLTLVIPLGITILALLVWFYAAVYRRERE